MKCSLKTLILRRRRQEAFFATIGALLIAGTIACEILSSVGFILILFSTITFSIATSMHISTIIRINKILKTPLFYLIAVDYDIGTGKNIIRRLLK